MNKSLFFIIMFTIISFVPTTSVYAKDTTTLLLQDSETESETKLINLFEKEYIVSVNNVEMRSGPGYDYPATGLLYKNDVVYVKSIKNGWAKFKCNDAWNYLPESAISKK